MGHSHLVGVGSLIYCKSTGRYLFLLRNTKKHNGHWGLVGGRLNEFEDVLIGLEREIKEELS